MTRHPHEGLGDDPANDQESGDVPPNPLADTGLSEDDWLRASAERDKTFEALLVFLDWRHKVMIRFALLVAGVVTAWHALPSERWQLQGLVLAFGAVACALVALMDAVNAGHIQRLYERGAYWEQLMYSGVGVFGSIRANAVDVKRVEWTTTGKPWPARRLSYTFLIKLLYNMASFVLLAGAIATWIHH